MPLKNGPRLEDSPGELDKTFATAGQIEIEQSGTANAIASDSEARLLLALQENNGFVLSRYGVDGEKDGDFKETHWNFEDGDVSTPTRVLLQEDNKIVLIGRSLKNGIERAAVTRFNSNGSPDLVFGRRVLPVPDNTVTPRLNYKFVDGCLQHGNKILVCACHKSGPLEVPLSRVYCLMGNGEPDETFGSDGGFINIMLHDQPSYVTDVQIQHDGKIIVAGSWTYSGKSKRTRTVARYTPTGVLDNTFGRAGYADIVVPDESSPKAKALDFADLVNRLVIQSDDKVLIAGYSPGADGRESGLLARLNVDGTVDADFHAGTPLLVSRPLNDLTLNALALQPDGKIVAVGRSLVAGTVMQCYERISETGELENFWKGNSIGDCSDVTIQPSGRVVIAGSSGASFTGARYPRVWGRVGN